MAGDVPLVGLRWELSGSRPVPLASGPVLTGGNRYGEIPDGGIFDIEDVPATPEGGWLTFTVEDIALRLMLIMPDADADLGTEARKFGVPPDIGPTPGPPGIPTVSGYSYYQARRFADPDVTARTAQMTSYKATLHDELMKGGIAAMVPFVTFYDGFIRLDTHQASTNDTYEVALITTHTFTGGESISSRRQFIARLNRNDKATVGLAEFNSSTEIPLGSYTTPAGETITITPAMLAADVQIKVEIEVKQEDGGQFQIDLLHVDGGVAWWQSGFADQALAKGEKGDPGEGEPGKQGVQGVWYADIFKVVTTGAVTPTPTGGSIAAAGTVTAPAGWTDDPETPGDGQELVQSRATVNPATAVFPISPPTWTAPFEAGGTGPAGPQGRGIASVTEPTAGTMRVTLTDNSHVDLTLPTGRGIKSITQPDATTVTVTLTDDSTVTLTLPKGPKGTDGIDGTDGVGIKSITDNNDQLTVTLTDDSTQGPFTLPRGPEGPQGKPGTAGSLGLTKVGETITITDGATGVDGPELTALNDIMMWELVYDRSPDSDLLMTALVRKADIATGFNLQMQGAGSEHVVISEADGNLHFQHDDGAVDNIKVDVFNVSSGTTGPPGPGVPDGGTKGQALIKKSAANQDTEWGAAGLATVTTAAPVSGDGSAGSAITIADGAIEAAKLKAGVIPDVSGIATNTKAISDETAARKTEDGKLAGRIDAADLKIAANTAARPEPSDTAPGNTPGTASAGSSADYSRADHDHGIEAGGSAFTPTQQNLYPSVKTMVEAITASSTINPIIGTDDDTNSEIKLGVAREIIGEDWGNLVVGHRFSIGTIVPRSGGWYICRKPHTKGGTGPDNDPTNWQVLTNWRGAWDDDGWYDPGSMVLQNDEVYVSLVAVTSSDPAPDNAANTKWKQISGGGSGGGGEGAGQRTEIAVATLPSDRSDITFNVSTAADGNLEDWRVGENIDFALILEAKDVFSQGNIFYGSLQWSHDTSINDDVSSKRTTTVVISTTRRSFADVHDLFRLNSNTSATAVSIRLRWTAVVGLSQNTWADLFDKISLVAIRAGSPGDKFTPSQANLFPFVDDMLKAGDGIALARNVPAANITASLDLTQALAYPTTKATLKAGDNVHIVPNDTGNELVISSDEADPAAPRLYAIDSRDKRNVHPPYHYDFITEGFTCQAGVARSEPGPVSIHGYNAAKPGDARDTTNGYNNANGVDFSNATAGTTKRTKRISVEVTPDNQRSYSADETLTIQVFADGYVKPNPAPEGQKIYEHVFHFQGGYQDPFNWDFDISYTNAPRSGEHDSWFVHWTWNVGSQQVVAGTIDAVKYTETLPALGSIPTQTFAASTPVLLNLLPGYTPATLKKEVTADSVVIGLTASGTSYLGTNGPDESDKADVLNPTFAHSSTNYKPYMRAAQDLSQVKITATASAAPTATGDVYLCTKAAGLPAQVIGNTKLGRGWTISYTGVALASQDYYLIVPAGGAAAAAGSPTAAWNANPGNSRINNVVDGIIHTAPLVAGINFSPTTASTITIQDPDLVEAGRAGLLHLVRIHSGGVVSSTSLRGIPRPLPEGSRNATTAVGPMRLRNSESGTAGNIVYCVMWWDMTGGKPSLHIRLTPTNSATLGSQNAYISGAEVEYLVYQ